MYTFVSILAVVACASAGRLENHYLAPLPASAPSAGGGADLQAPYNTYLPPQPAVAAQQDAPVVVDAFQRRTSQFSSVSAPTPAARQVAIIKLSNENPGDGSYAFSYETEDGTVAEERGQLKPGRDAEGTQSAQGSFSFTAPDNVRYTVTYTADENGFQPQGAHLPVPPPIPAEIQRALEANAADEARGLFDDGSYREETAQTQGYQQRTQQTQQIGYSRDRPSNAGYRY